MQNIVGLNWKTPNARKYITSVKHGTVSGHETGHKLRNNVKF